METIEGTPLFQPNPPHVYEAINNVSRRVAKEGITKNRKNTQQGYNFRGIDDVYNALAIPMAEEHLCIMPRVLSREVTERETQKGGVLFYVVLDMEFDFVSAKDGSKHTIKVVGEAMDSADKATNKAMSAAYKYACMQTFCIPTEGDNDADATTHEVAPMKHSPKDGIDLSGVDEEQMYQYADNIKALLDGGDTAGAGKLWRELRRDEQVFVWGIKQPHGLNMKHKEALRGLDREAA